MSLACCMVAVFVACSDDKETDAGEQGGHVLQMGSCLTRAAGASFVEDTQLTFFLTRGDNGRRFLFAYDAEADTWDTAAKTEEGQVYYLYGYMPTLAAPSSAIEPISGDYANGAVLTINGLEPIGQQDVCFVTGVKGGDDVTRESDINEWNYQYEGRKEDNHVNFLLDHLYAAVNLNFTVSETYDRLRTIKLKEVRLQSPATTKTNAQITLAANTAPAIVYTTNATAATASPLMSSDSGEALTTATPVTVGCYVLPSLTGLTLACTYDVYDKSGNLLRQDCTAENNLFNRVSMTSGTRTTLNLLVGPTYLYMLSDEDLNNPLLEVRSKR